MDPDEANSIFSSFYSVNDGEKEKCTYYNKTSKRIITSAYEGIPENLLLNFLGWLVCITHTLKQREIHSLYISIRVCIMNESSMHRFCFFF